jgi:LPXTG-motif cell wall-anchored protein
VKQASFENNSFNVPGRTTAVFVIEEEKPAPEPTTESTTPSETPASNSNTLTIAGIIVALLAIAGLGIFLRRRQKV